MYVPTKWQVINPKSATNSKPKVVRGLRDEHQIWIVVVFEPISISNMEDGATGGTLDVVSEILPVIQ